MQVTKQRVDTHKPRVSPSFYFLYAVYTLLYKTLGRQYQCIINYLPFQKNLNFCVYFKIFKMASHTVAQEYSLQSALPQHHGDAGVAQRWIPERGQVLRNVIKILVSSCSHFSGKKRSRSRSRSSPKVYDEF